MATRTIGKQQRLADILNGANVRIPIDAGRCFRREAGHDSGAMPDTIPTRRRTPFRIEAGHPQVMWAA